MTEEEFIQELQDIFQQFSDEGVSVEIYPTNNNQILITISDFIGKDIIENIQYPLLDETYAKEYSRKVIFQLNRFKDHYEFTYSIVIGIETINIIAYQNANPPIEEEVVNPEELPF